MSTEAVMIGVSGALMLASISVNYAMKQDRQVASVLSLLSWVVLLSAFVQVHKRYDEELRLSRKDKVNASEIASANRWTSYEVETPCGNRVAWDRQGTFRFPATVHSGWRSTGSLLGGGERSGRSFARVGPAAFDNSRTDRGSRSLSKREF